MAELKDAERPGASHGSIELIIGPMFSEKTTEMLSRVRRAALAGKAGYIVKHSNDVRYDAEALATHANVRQTSQPGSAETAPIIVAAHAALGAVDVGDALVVGVDEGQFFPDLAACCEAWANRGLRVIVAALDGDFARRPFGQIPLLVPLCELVEKRRGVCMLCRERDSAYTMRLVECAELVLVGAKEAYRSVCRECYFRSKPAL